MTITKAHQKLQPGSLLLWIIAAILLFYKLGDTATWQSEDRWLEIASEMIRSGNIFRPTINGAIYFDKPLLSYWLELVAAILSGGLDEFAMRAPSAVSALLALWATMNLGKRLWSEQIGIFAGWILLTSFGFLQWGRLGEADMENLAATIGAVAWYWRQRDRHNFSSYLVFYLIIAIGSQCKGLTAAVVPALAIAPDIVRERRWRRHLNAAHAGAALLALGVYMLPFLAANVFSDNAPAAASTSAASSSAGLHLVLRENIVRYFAPFDHTGPVYTYLISIPQYLFPWSPLFIAALAAACTKKFRQLHNVGWLVWALALIFLFFTLSGSRRNYYILPILPYCALLSARFLLADTQASLRKWATHITLALALGLAAILAATPLFWPWLEQKAGGALPHEFKTINGMVGAICLLSFAWMYWRRSYRANFEITAIAASATILWAGFFFWQQPVIDRYRTEIQFATDLKELLEARGNATTLLYQEKPTGRLLYYANITKPVVVAKTPDQVEQFLAAPPFPKCVLALRKNAGELPASLRDRKPDLVEEQYHWEKKAGDKILAWYISK